MLKSETTPSDGGPTRQGGLECPAEEARIPTRRCRQRRTRPRSAWLALLAAVGAVCAAADEPFRPDPAWTPPPKEGKVADWQKTTDKDWIDGRFQQMDAGPFQNASVRIVVGGQTQLVQRATAIRVGDKGEATMLFDRNQLRWCGAWVGRINHGNIRFGLLNTAVPSGPLIFGASKGIGCAGEGRPLTDSKGDAPLPRSQARFLSLTTVHNRVFVHYALGDAQVVEHPWHEKIGAQSVFERWIRVTTRQGLSLLAADAAGPDWRIAERGKSIRLATAGELHCAVAPYRAGVRLRSAGRRLWIDVPAAANDADCRFVVVVWRGKSDVLDGESGRLAASLNAPSLQPLPGGRPTRIWGMPIRTSGVLGSNNGPLAVDTLTVPFQNPYKALFFISGLDFLPDGRIAVCTAHGDVWLVRADSQLANIEWKRFATGLYQPLGLKVVDGAIHVIERGQITRLIDRNGDDEADAYECFADSWYTGAGEHSFDTRLETDPQGNFYFFKTGDTDTPTGGCLMRVSKDGSRAEIYATGFRHPIGLGMSPFGRVTGSDQQGNWMPASKIDEYRRGGFYGDMRAHHRSEKPRTLDVPMCWIPHEIDNSSGGQIWVPQGAWGPLAGRMLHCSWGMCKLFLTYRQEVGGAIQGALADLGIGFESGPIGGRFHPQDGHLYVAGLTGWQTAARKDGCLQRVRYTGKPFRVPLKVEVVRDGLRVDFGQPLDGKLSADPSRYRYRMWGYHWTNNYGSARYSTRQPDRQGEDALPVAKTTLLPEGAGVHLAIAGFCPTMQWQLEYDVADANQVPVRGFLHGTIHKLP